MNARALKKAALGGGGIALLASALYVLVPREACACITESYVRRAMKMELRNLVTAQESFFADNGTYSTSPEMPNESPEARVQVTVDTASSTGWRGHATSRLFADELCVIHIGAVTPSAPGAGEGEPLCRERIPKRLPWFAKTVWR